MFVDSEQAKSRRNLVKHIVAGFGVLAKEMDVERSDRDPAPSGVYLGREVAGKA
jgi:hypothetical protein